jgi:hypothetical protein
MVYAESSQAMNIQVKLAYGHHAVGPNSHCSIEFHSLNAGRILMQFKVTLCACKHPRHIVETMS